jgi:mono/diheme cytochrome c family protein
MQSIDPRAAAKFWILFGAILLLAAEGIAAAVIASRAHGWSAREAPTSIERWIARRVRNAALPADAKSQVNPVPNTIEILVDARAHWADHCASCHANDGSGDTTMGKGMFPPAPDMRRSATQDLSDGELFYIIQNGIRLTGMPAWGGGSSHDAEDSWKLVRFIRHLPSMTAEERRSMEKLNPKSPDEWKEEQEEEKFLKGETTDAPEQHHHH